MEKIDRDLIRGQVLIAIEVPADLFDCLGKAILDVSQTDDGIFLP